MSQSEHPVVIQLDRLFAELIDQAQQQYQRKPLCDYDAEWQSPCHIADTETQGEQGPQIEWQPVKHPELKLLSGIVESLEIDVHQDVQQYFGSYFAECLPAVWAPQGEEPGSLTLIFCHSDNDLDLLQQNQLGHSLAKQKNKLEQNWFFATTDNDLVICLNQQTGEVELEKPGYKPMRSLAPSLAEFLADCRIDKTRI